MGDGFSYGERLHEGVYFRNMLAIRPAEPVDAPLILELIHERATYEREPHAVVATEADLLRDGFGERPFFQCHIAEFDGVPAGFAFYFFNYSTWRGRPGIHLEDLFVRRAFRGKGIGKALLMRVAEVAVENQFARFQWDVLDWNQSAIDFYHSLGAKFMSEWRIMRVSGEALIALAAGEPIPDQPASVAPGAIS
jgi:GNAT superfamily N-acetyltransferase